MNIPAEDDSYTLLAITQLDDPPSEEYLRRHAPTLRNMIQQQDRVSLRHLFFGRRGRVDYFVPPSNSKSPKASYCHPQLASYINWYPTFILVRDGNYYDITSDLEVSVFNRVIKDGNYKPGGVPHVPANIVMWVSEEMDEVERRAMGASEASVTENSCTESIRDAKWPFTEAQGLHRHLEEKGVFSDSL